jgi:DNA (cytosine-5)-methyltransferase 1
MSKIIVGTYRVANEAWIRERRLYNLPLAEGITLDAYRNFEYVVLFCGAHPAIASKIVCDRIVDRDQLRDLGYSVSSTPHGSRYVLFRLEKMVQPSLILGGADSEVCVCSTRYTGKVDASFFEKPVPDVGGHSIPNIFENLRPYYREWSSCIAFNPVQSDFFDALFMRKQVDSSAVGHLSHGLRVGTLFSGIGAFEQALKKQGIEHSIVFACDNGEIELVPLEKHRRMRYKDLERRAKRLNPSENAEFLDLKREVEAKIAQIRRRVRNTRDPKVQRLVVQEAYSTYAPGEKNLVKETYQKNYPVEDSQFHFDVRFLDGRGYRGKIDMMVGGSPCQSFSSNGKRLGIADTRGTLFFDYARLLDEISPRCFIFENVKGMIVHDGGRTWKIVKDTFEELNYNIYLSRNADGTERAVLNAKEFGIPQNRERIFLVGIRKDIKLKSKFVFPEPIRLTKSVEDFLDEKVPEKYYLAQKGFEFVTTHPTRAQVGQKVMNCQKANQQFNWNGDFIFEPLQKFKGGRPPKKAFVGEFKGQLGVCRMFTPRECLRLMGFPDDFKMAEKDTVMYRQCGNSIVVDVLEAIVVQLQKAGVFE